jgi:hypothetical protein
MLEKIKIILFLFLFGVGSGFACGWLVYSWIDAGQAPVDVGGYSKIGAAITTTLLILLSGVTSIGCLIATVCLFFVDSSVLAAKKKTGEEAGPGP